MNACRAYYRSFIHNNNLPRALPVPAESLDRIPLTADRMPTTALHVRSHSKLVGESTPVRWYGCAGYVSKICKWLPSKIKYHGAKLIAKDMKRTIFIPCIKPTNFQGEHVSLLYVRFNQSSWILLFSNTSKLIHRVNMMHMDGFAIDLGFVEMDSWVFLHITNLLE